MNQYRYKFVPLIKFSTGRTSQICFLFFLPILLFFSAQLRMCFYVTNFASHDLIIHIIIAWNIVYTMKIQAIHVLWGVRGVQGWWHWKPDRKCAKHCINLPSYNYILNLIASKLLSLTIFWANHKHTHTNTESSWVRYLYTQVFLDWGWEVLNGFTFYRGAWLRIAGVVQCRAKAPIVIWVWQAYKKVDISWSTGPMQAVYSFIC